MTLVPQRWWLPGLVATLGTLVLAGCAGPSNARNWSPELAVLPYAEFHDPQVTVHNIRNCSYLSEHQYVVQHHDKTYDLDRLRSVDFLVVPFAGLPMLAHTMLSFGFEGDDYLAVSVEIRKEKGEEYGLAKGLSRQFELIYVVADERDLIPLRTEHRKVDVYLYRSRAAPQQARQLFADVFRRVNQLAVQPEYYDTFTNNCTTNIARHVNNLVPDRVPWSMGVLLPGYSDRLAYDLGLIESHGTFDQTRRQARINELAHAYCDAPDFSAKIRQGEVVAAREVARE